MEFNKYTTPEDLQIQGAVDPEDWRPEDEDWNTPDDERTVEIDGGEN